MPITLLDSCLVTGHPYLLATWQCSAETISYQYLCRGVMFLPVSGCLCTREHDYTKSIEAIFMKPCNIGDPCYGKNSSILGLILLKVV